MITPNIVCHDVGGNLLQAFVDTTESLMPVNWQVSFDNPAPVNSPGQLEFSFVEFLDRK